MKIFANILYSQNLFTHIHEDSAEKNSQHKIRDAQTIYIKQTYNLQPLDQNVKDKEETLMYCQKDNGSGERRMP